MSPLYKKYALALIMLACMHNIVYAAAAPKPPVAESDFTWLIAGKFKPEMFYGNNITYLNDVESEDRAWYSRHTLDTTVSMLYGKRSYYHDVIEAKFQFRNKVVWGNPASVAPTTETGFKVGDAYGYTHKHALTRLFPWMREAWMQIELNEIFKLNSLLPQYFTIGSFSFELGRGIALGDAYAVGSDLLGFYTDGAVDQFAFGSKIGGDIVEDRLSYDIYGAILENKSAGISDNALPIYKQQYGRQSTPERGFGNVNYVIATHLNWYPLKDGINSWLVEPYIMYNSAPEQKIEFTADASTKLATVGVASEFEGEKVGWGFDVAMNFGSQRVKGWDRNIVLPAVLNGRDTQVNSHVLVGVNPKDATTITAINNGSLDLTKYRAIVSPNTVDAAGNITSVGKDAQKLANGAPQAAANNGALLGTVAGYSAAVGNIPSPVSPALADQFYNAPSGGLFPSFGRFRDPYVNTYTGWMAVGDIGYWLYKKDLQIAFTAGFASGDQDPNAAETNKCYNGFVPLQEVYSGKRVQSVFVSGGAGRLKRPGNISDPEIDSERFAFSVDGFSNIALVGGGMKWEPQDWKRKFSFRPNMLFYWEASPSKKFDLKTGADSSKDASPFIGTELNAFVDYWLFKNLKCFAITSVFLPGQHYRDIKGKPLDNEDVAFLDQLDVNDTIAQKIPGLGSDLSWTMNFGLEFKF